MTTLTEIYLRLSGFAMHLDQLGNDAEAERAWAILDYIWASMGTAETAYLQQAGVSYYHGQRVTDPQG